MSNTLKYNGFVANVEYSVEDMALIGTVIGVSDKIVFECDDLSRVQETFEETINEYLEMCEEIGKYPQKSYTGSFNVRIDPELHRKVAILSAKEGITLNQFVSAAIGREAERKESINTKCLEAYMAQWKIDEYSRPKSVILRNESPSWEEA